MGSRPDFAFVDAGDGAEHAANVAPFGAVLALGAKKQFPPLSTLQLLPQITTPPVRSVHAVPLKPEQTGTSTVLPQEQVYDLMVTLSVHAGAITDPNITVT